MALFGGFEEKIQFTREYTLRRQEIGSGGKRKKEKKETQCLKKANSEKNGSEGGRGRKSRKKGIGKENGVGDANSTLKRKKRGKSRICQTSTWQNRAFEAVLVESRT